MSRSERERILGGVLVGVWVRECAKKVCER